MRVPTGRLRVVPIEVSEPGPAELSNPSPGQYLREQRQRRGISIEQLSAATKIPRASLALLEEDNFEQLPGPVFAKGFLRCVARALGLDPDTVLALLYERERQLLLARKRERPASGAFPSMSIQNGRIVAPPRRTIQRTEILLWVAIALFVAVLLLGAFALASSGRLSSPQS